MDTGTGTAAFGALSYTGSLTGGTGVVNIGSGQLYKDSSGNIGVGVIPSAWDSTTKALQFSVGAFASSVGLGTVAALNAYYNGAWRYQTSAGAMLYSQVGVGHQWSVAPSGTAGNTIQFTQAMTLDASGNLNIAQIGANLFNANGFSLMAPLGYMITNHVAGSASGVNYNYFAYAGASIGSISQSGTTAVLYNTTSDARLKTNIVDAPAASVLIDSIQVRSFDWISDSSHQRYGMVAQELFEVAPEAVHQPVNPTDMMAVDYSKLVPMLIKEVQSLRARMAALEAK